MEKYDNNIKHVVTDYFPLTAHTRLLKSFLIINNQPFNDKRRWMIFFCIHLFIHSDEPWTLFMCDSFSPQDTLFNPALPPLSSRPLFTLSWERVHQEHPNKWLLCTSSIPHCGMCQIYEVWSWRTIVRKNEGRETKPKLTYRHKGKEKR